MYYHCHRHYYYHYHCNCNYKMDVTRANLYRNCIAFQVAEKASWNSTLSIC